MKLFLDTADVDEIRTAARWGVLDGVMTNFARFATSGGRFDDVLTEICRIAPGPVIAELVAEDAEGVLCEGRHLVARAPNITVAVPMSESGLEAIARLAAQGIRTSCTMISSAGQGLLAAKAGASFLSPLVGRLDGSDGRYVDPVRETVVLVNTHALRAEVLAASIRRPRDVTEVALAGAHVAAVSFAVLRQMMRHPLADTGVARCARDRTAGDARREHGTAWRELQQTPE